eukprot:c12512_g1_i2.p1 GENE.c12512_g1_i2~~c12512_g1_i2.p1  ORF type:complete len:270 (+),score=78.55 c12512_g1_i2:101-811(+)
MEGQVPVILCDLLARLELTGGHTTEGVFRIPGSKSAVEEEKAKLNAGANSLTLTDVHDVASLLKLWFRELPYQLIPADIAEQCNQVSSKPQEERGAFALAMLAKVPEPNQSTCRFLIRALQPIARNKEVTKMDAKNLAVVFAPSLLTKGEEEARLERMRSSGTGGVLERSNTLLLMTQMHQGVDQQLDFVVALIEHLPEKDEVEEEEIVEEEEEGFGFFGFFKALLCVAPRDDKDP